MAPYASSAASQNHQASSTAAPVPHFHQPSHHPSSSSAGNLVDPYALQQNRYAPPQRATAADLGQSRPDEVYRLPENANLAIPEEVRKQFQQDEQGHILFFTAPPVDTLPSVKPGSAVGHTAKFLATGLPNRKVDVQKRAIDASPSITSKRVKQQREDVDLAVRIEKTKTEAFDMLINRIENGTTQVYKDIYGTSWEKGIEHEAVLLKQHQAEATQKLQNAEQRRRRRLAKRETSIAPGRIFKDDWNPRY